MNGQHDKHKEIESKLRGGLQTLSEASAQDKDKLGMALITIHSALEDFIRFEVVRKAPDLRERVEDVQQTRWNNLLDYGRIYLDFSDSDCRRINDANALRLRVAHGGDYTIRHAYLVEYASLVERLCKAGQPLPVTTPRKWEITTPARKPEVRQPSYRDPDRKPRDRSQGCLPSLVAYSMVVGIILAGIGFLAYFDLFANPFRDWLQLLNSSFLSTAAPQSNDPPAVNEAAPAMATDLPLQPTSGHGAMCTIVWEEYTAGDLAGKNRFMVWEEIVKFQVNGSGMTHREFYDLVAEQNPDLKTDGYEFKRGKTYVLPKCQ